MRALLTWRPRGARLGRDRRRGARRARTADTGALRAALGALALLAGACADAPYIELQLADVELPFLQAERDFDGVRVDVRREGCSDATQRFAAAPLPATITVVPGDCYADALELAATVTLGELYAEMGASVEQLPVPAQLGPRAAARWSRDADARAALHLDKARVLFDVASGQGALADPGLAPRVSAGRRASAPR